MIGGRRSEREHAEAHALWLDAMRIAERVGDLDVRANPTLGRRALQVCGGALADPFDSIRTREPATAESAIRDAVAALDQWAQFRRRQWESERQEPPPSLAAHVLVAPSLAELTVASVRDGSADLTEMYGAAELPSQHMLLRLAKYLATGGSCEVTVDALLELDDSDLRYALEGIALHRKLWRVAGDLRRLDAARALQATAGGPDGR